MLVAAASLAIVASNAAAQAQSAGTAGEVSEDEIVVTGYAAQNSRAIDAKRTNEQIGEFLSGDDIGQQPDYNISDSFRRLPGVQTVFDEDEGRYVGIRGLNPNFTFGTLDGSAIATAERGNRQLNMEAIPTTAVKRLEVYKSRTPDIEGNAIGGTINLVTRSAFDAPGTVVLGSAFIGMGDSQEVPGKNHRRKGDDGINYRGDATLSTPFGREGQFGLVVTGSYSRKRRDQERFNPAGYRVVNEVPVATGLMNQGYPNTVDRYGGTAKLEWKPEDGLYVALSATHFQQDDNENRLSHQLTTGTIDATQTGGNSAHVATAGGFARFNDFPIEKPLTAIQGKVDWDFDDDNKLSARGSWSKATFLEASNQLQFNLPTSAANAFDYTIRNGIPSATLIDASTFNDPANYTFASYNPYRDKSDDFIQEFALDYRHNTEVGGEGLGFAVGAKYRRNKRDFDRYQNVYALAAGTSLKLADVAQANDYMPKYLPYPMQIIDFGAFDAWRFANPDALVLNQATSARNGLANDYLVTEKVAAGYALARYATEAATLIVGGRYEHTDTDVAGYRVAGSALTPLERSSSYDDFLPSAALNYDLTDALKLRLSYAKALGRPNPSELGTNETLDQVALTVNRGNPDLKPRKADNYDLSVEYYLPGDEGAVTFAMFYKDIRNDIFSAAAGTTVIDGVSYTVTQPQNLDGSRVFGLEFGLIKNRLGFLPGFLANFGVSGNVTWLDAKAELPGGTTFDRLIQQPEWQFNAALFYEGGPFKARATYAKVGSQYTAISESDPLANRYDTAFQQLDLQARVTLGGIDVIAEIRNASDERRRNFDGYGTRDENRFGRQFWLGAAFRL